MPYSVINVNRKEYLDSIAQIDDTKSRGFADQALRWWDRHYSWNAEGSVILTDDAGAHLCYLFYKIDRYHEYLTIHNILTPLCHRRHGYALMLLQWVFELAVQHHVRRFKAVCVPQSLDFYLSLGFCYWGLTSTKDYYCNLPVPVSGLDGLREMVESASAETLAGTALQSIHDRVADNDASLDTAQQNLHDKGLAKLQDAYMQTELIACMEDAKGQEKGNKPGM
ncbi:GNAT family N-acetyltransferase [Thiomicrolovo sp. ZZH C-3]